MQHSQTHQPFPSSLEVLAGMRALALTAPEFIRRVDPWHPCEVRYYIADYIADWFASDLAAADPVCQALSGQIKALCGDGGSYLDLQGQPRARAQRLNGQWDERFRRLKRKQLVLLGLSSFAGIVGSQEYEALVGAGFRRLHGELEGAA